MVKEKVPVLSPAARVPIFTPGNASRIASLLILMVGFGASFGLTVMGRVSLLIDRIQFLLTDWLGLIA